METTITQAYQLSGVLVIGGRIIVTAIFRALQRLEKYPGIYIDEKSIRQVRVFIAGAFTCDMYQYVSDMNDHPDKAYMLFEQMIRKRCHAGFQEGTENALIRVAGDEFKAYDLFFKLMHEYLAELNE